MCILCILYCAGACHSTETFKTSHGHGPKDQTICHPALEIPHSFFSVRSTTSPGHECLIRDTYHSLLE